MNRASAPRYDLFKLVVTIVLVIILILMLLRGCATTPATQLPAEPDAVSVPTQSSETPAETEAVPATDTAEPATSSPAPSVTPTLVGATSTPTAEPATATPVSAATETPETATAEPATTAVTPTQAAADSTSCNTRVPSRLSVGQTARVVQRLNLRNAASISAPILQTNPVNAQVEIIGGPVCTPVGDSAYLWWQIRSASGAEGWSAESPLNEATYLLEPVQ